MKQHGLSIRRVLIGLGAFGILTVCAVASFGLLGIQRQLEARHRVIILDRALHNHTESDTFMDDIRTDVLRALQDSAGANKEGASAIRADFRHHIDSINHGIGENLRLPLAAPIHASYGEIARLTAGYITVGHAAVELALANPVAGAANFEKFRHGFSDLEQAMDGLRDVLRAQVQQVRREAALTATRVEWMIVGASLGGVVLLVLITTLAVRIAGGITADLASSREEAQRLALHDPLTGLANRAFLGERLVQSLAHARRHGGALAILCLDLDRFKQVNDTLGHPVGDALLRTAAERLRGCLRRSDTVARLGGDEFAVIQTPVGGPEEAGLLARRIVETLSEPYDLGGHHVVIGASAGIALAPSDASDASGLLKMADMALYRAKAEGRGTFRFFEAGMDALLQARRVLELELRGSVRAQEFELHYQPLVDLGSGRVDACEALLRWRHPVRGLVPPAEFIPLAEETGIIVPLEAWVLHRACADAVRWPAHVRVAVNVSAAQFKGSVLIAAVNEALAETGLEPNRLELEITETALLNDAESTLAVLRELRAKGVRIAMDDFGTGYSSLGYLRSFPFDKIKIDRCFVQDIETSADCKAIVHAIAGLGTNLGIAITAEGVETQAQLARLRAEGCGQVQGFLISRPVPVAEIGAMLHSGWATGVEPAAGAATQGLARPLRWMHGLERERALGPQRLTGGSESERAEAALGAGSDR